MLGQTFVKVESGEDVLTFFRENGSYIRFEHHQDCCESVTIEDICGELSHLEGSPILMAEMVTSDESSDAQPNEEHQNRRYRDNCELWTFYKFATIKGYVTVRWYGTSNGYYSVDVSQSEYGSDGRRVRI